jgi:fumarate reductase subunit C
MFSLWASGRHKLTEADFLSCICFVLHLILIIVRFTQTVSSFNSWYNFINNEEPLIADL